jgi:PLP dependent protein
LTEPSPDPVLIDAFARASADVRGRMSAACERSGRDPSSVSLVAVSKTVDAERLRAAVAAGLTVLGENRVQEGAAKAPDVPGASWRLVGPLQSNKARRALEVFDEIHSIDSVELASRLDRLWAELAPGRRYPVLLQVNVDLDPAKHGIQPDTLADLLPQLLGLSNLEIGGLMTVGRYTVDPEVARSTFRQLRALSARLRDRWPALGPALSMGMSDDYEVAIEEGSTIVRVGRAIFGDRPAPG